MTSSVLCLAGAIVLEVLATLSLARLGAMRAPAPVLFTALAYAGAFYLLSQALRTITVGVAYAIWSGVGIVFIVLAGWLLLKQRLDAPSLAGIALIMIGVCVIAMFSRSV